MVFPTSYEQKTGFDQIKAQLRSNCLSSLGQQYVDNIRFCNNYNIILLMLEQVEEFRQILLFENRFPAQNYHNMQFELQRLKVEGTYIDIENFFLLRESLQAIDACVAFFANTNKYPHLSDLMADIEWDDDILAQTDDIAGEHHTIKDSASPELREIRQSIRQKQAEADRQIRHLMNKAKQDGILPADAEMSIRDGRLVLPVPAQFKRRIRGFVHDESATGQTFFIEPEEVFDTNNELRELVIAEHAEIIRILTEFTEYIRPFIPDLLIAYKYLGLIDFIRAKAKFALSINGIKPILQNQPLIQWQRAVHPLLYLNFKQQKREIVPLDITLTPQKRILIVSGPNAGGKSVCLKTVGLLQYMLQCGLLVPTYENSEFGVFSHLFIDIGDQQSIEDDLSTYSSHLKNMKLLVEKADSRSLFLLDEFGSGTEPSLGGAVAESILERLSKKKSFGVVTTHFGNLKLLAGRIDGVENAAMLFDTEHLKPLFRLNIGRPGSSFTFEIAKSIGFPNEILEQAKQKTGTAQVDYEQKLQTLEVERLELEQRQKMFDAADNQLAELIAQYQQKYDQLEASKQEILNQARSEAKQVLKDANKLIEKTIREIKESKADKERTQQLRKNVHEAEKQLNKPTPQEQPKPSTTPAVFDKNTPIKQGDKVCILATNTVGTVESISGKNIVVAFNAVRLKTTINSVEKISNSEARQKSRNETATQSGFGNQLLNKVSSFNSTLDLRGERAEDAINITTKYLDDAVLVGVHQVRILHGKGTGVLRSIIRQLLSHHKDVESFSDERLELGGAGITVVNLR